MDAWPDTIDVFFATNREMEDGDGEPRFSKTGTPDAFRFGCATLTPPGDWLPVGDGDPIDVLDRWDRKWQRTALTVERQALADAGAARAMLGASATLAPLKAALADPDGDVLILIHGFASTFDLALKRAAEIAVRYSPHADRPLPVLAVAWSANGTSDLINYPLDREAARRARRAIANLLEAIVTVRDSQGGARLHLIAHSMGNFALRHAVQRLIGWPPSPRIPDSSFANVFLMAADEDWDTLTDEDKLKPILVKAQAVHVYYARRDFVLKISDVWNKNRLGQLGPARPFDLPANVNLVDCTAVCSTSVISQGAHQYYRARPEVYRDVRAILTNTPPENIAQRQEIIGGWQILPA